MAWCDAPFGPPSTIQTQTGLRKKINYSYMCRKIEGHDGEHSCPKSDSDGYIDLPAPPLREDLQRLSRRVVGR
jgi:hypothetical protein